MIDRLPRRCPPALAASAALSVFTHVVVLASTALPSGPEHDETQVARGGRLVTRLEPVRQSEPTLAVPARFEAVNPSPPVLPALPAASPVPIALPAGRTVPTPARYERPALVTVSTDPDLAVDATFEALLASEHAGLARVGLEFVDAPEPIIPAAAVREVHQRRLRALVVVRDDGAIDLVRTDEYDAMVIAAIREVLGSTRARPPADAGTHRPGWAIVEFWIEQPGQAPPR